LGLRERANNEPRRHEGRKGFVFYLIGVADQVNHHALTGNIYSSQGILPVLDSLAIAVQPSFPDADQQLFQIL
jgi:hypothetical protein